MSLPNGTGKGGEGWGWMEGVVWDGFNVSGCGNSVVRRRYRVKRWRRCRLPLMDVATRTGMFWGDGQSKEEGFMMGVRWWFFGKRMRGTKIILGKATRSMSVFSNPCQKRSRHENER